MELETLLGSRSIGLLYLPGDYAVPRKGFGAVWRRHLVANAGVRDREYMEHLFHSHFPNGVLLELKDARLPADIAGDGDNIVLLYPDSIGMDFPGIERALARQCPSRNVFVLNGRRRFFRLDRDMRRRLRLRRWLVAVRLPEFAFLLLFVLVTPLLVINDFVRGRR